MRRALLSVTVGLAGAGTVTGVAWSVQTLALPAPTRAARVAAGASRWLAEHQAVVVIFHSDGHRSKGLCLSGWFGVGQGRLATGSLLALPSGAQYLVAAKEVLRDRGFGRRQPSPPLAAAVGCAQNLEQALLPGEQTLRDLDARRAYAAGRPAIALRLRDAGDRLFTLYVAAGTYQPLVAMVHSPSETVTARLYLAHRSPFLLARFHISGAQWRRRT